MIVENTRRKAFTLIEIVVVLAILGVVFTLVLAAVQASRESARRASCAKNLREFGVALNGYASVNRRYPKDGYLDSFSFVVEILPYIGRPNLFNSMNFRVSSYDRNVYPNDSARSISLDVFLCPADRGRGAGHRGCINYAGNMGSGVLKFGYNGAFVLQAKDATMAVFTDGTSQTAAMSEWILGMTSSDVRDPNRTVFETPKRLRNLDEFADDCHHLDAPHATPSVMAKGFDWIIAEFGHSLYNHVLPPNDKSCLNGSAIQEGAWTAGSRHAGGGAYVLFVDGHVQWVEQGVSREIWQALGSRNGGETISADSY